MIEVIKMKGSLVNAGVFGAALLVAGCSGGSSSPEPIPPPATKSCVINSPSDVSMEYNFIINVTCNNLGSDIPKACYNDVKGQEVCEDLAVQADGSWNGSSRVLYPKIDEITDETLKDSIDVTIKNPYVSQNIAIYPTKQSAKKIFELAADKKGLTYQRDGKIYLDEGEVLADVLVKLKCDDVPFVYSPTDDQNKQKQWLSSYMIPTDMYITPYVRARSLYNKAIDFIDKNNQGNCKNKIRPRSSLPP